MVVGEGKRGRITVDFVWGVDGGARAILVMRGYGKSGEVGGGSLKGGFLGPGAVIEFVLGGITSQTQKFYVP